MSVCARACVRDVFAIYDNDILPRLIMIIIKIIMLYFIQIRHTDDFLLNGYSSSVTKCLYYNVKSACSLLTFRHHLKLIYDLAYPP